ncbi:MAG: substrate-binding domain-containing protein [Actinomycetes bacterium]
MSTLHRPRAIAAAGLTATAALLLAACSGGSPATTSSAGSSPSTAATTSSTPDAFLASVEATVAQKEAPQTTWTGPTSGPVASTGKKIVYLSGQESNSLDAAYGQYLQQVATKIGWTVTIIDGKGSPTGWLAGMNQAVALHPDGIIIFANAASLQAPIAAATAAHIPVVGLHAASVTGPTRGLYTNIQEDATAIGTTEADYAIAASHGTARAIIVTHNEYGIARIKSDAMRAEIAKCTGCTLLAFDNFPAAEASTRIAQLATSWVSTYGTNFYAMTVGDNDWDFAVPALSAGGVSPSGPNSPKLIGSDGIPSAYQRIRSGQYEVATVPEPAQEEAYYAIYQMNRAFHGLSPDTWFPPTYLVTHANVNSEGGSQNVFDPSNNYQQHFVSLLTTGHS